MNDLIAFTCLFGNGFQKLYPAPLANSSFVFTNNKNIKSECEQKGWNYKYIDVKIPDFIKDNFQRFSLQSKYVKFLEVTKDFPELFNSKKYALYFDHKFEVKENHIRDLLDIDAKGLIIRETPRFKNSVYEEIREAALQPRYRARINELNNWVKGKLSEGYSSNARICNTGLILYNLKNQKVLNLCKEVYEATMQVLNPECQAIWCILSQRHKDHIKTIPFQHIPINWKDPGTYGV